MVSVKTEGRKIDFLENCIAESTVHVFVLIPNLFLTLFIEIKNFWKTISCLEKKWNVFTLVHQKVTIKVIRGQKLEKGQNIVNLILMVSKETIRQRKQYLTALAWEVRKSEVFENLSIWWKKNK